MENPVILQICKEKFVCATMEEAHKIIANTNIGICLRNGKHIIREKEFDTFEEALKYRRELGETIIYY